MEGFLEYNIWIFMFLAAWTLPWKGVALWRATRQNHKKWFIALLILNTLAILEILYIFVFSKKKQSDDLAASSVPLFEDL